MRRTMPRRFIKSAIKRPGALTRRLGRSKKTGKLSVMKAARLAKKGGLAGKQARFFMNVLHPASQRKKAAS